MVRSRKIHRTSPTVSRSTENIKPTVLPKTPNVVHEPQAVPEPSEVMLEEVLPKSRSKKQSGDE